VQRRMARIAERDQVRLLSIIAFASGHEVMTLQVVGRSAGDAEGKPHGTPSSMDITDLGLNGWPRSLTYPWASSAADMSLSERLRPLTG
jgi:hypothetical protein